MNMLDEMRLAEVMALPLQSGGHAGIEDGLCVMEAVAYIAGEKWSDSPQCACPVISAFLRNWNDNLPDAERNDLLRDLIPRLVGTRSTPAVEQRRATMAADWLSRTGYDTARDPKVHCNVVTVWQSRLYRSVA